MKIRYLLLFIALPLQSFCGTMDTVRHSATVQDTVSGEYKSQIISEESDSPGINWNIPMAIGSIGITAILLKTDQHTSDALFQWKMNHHFAGQVSRNITNLGDGKASLAIFGGAILYSLASDNKRPLELGKIGLESFVFSGVVTQLLKQVIGRQRPNVSTTKGGKFSGPFSYFRQKTGNRQGISSFDAFPSGHTTTVFSAATVIADYANTPWVTYSSYTIATVASLSRITERMHWASDVFVGGLIGYYSTKLVEKMNTFSPDVSLSPVASQESWGMMLRLKL
ncbi:MAG: phosphatase PAP2 family protein [Bacteroidota bacterium]